jgi:hypothetical protein
LRLFAVASLFILLVTSPLFAAKSWLSKARSSPSGAKATSARTIFDVTISLYRSPSGDDDPDHDTGAEEQTPYENIIRHWADAACEESNGAHRLGKVRIFRNGRFSGLADVIWNEKEDQISADVSGFGTAGRHIYFGDVFTLANNHNMLADEEGAGYTLGHEWGHYVYGLYDEYVGNSETAPIYHPRKGDTAVQESIMNSQWNARGGHFHWLNHSTSNNYQANTAQGRVYGASGWEVLVRASADDPRDGDRKALPERTQYTSLTGREPTADHGWFRIELPGERDTCRSDLEIIWVPKDLALQLVIDRSGSMFGAPLANAKQAGKSLVDVAPGGETSLGLVSFNQSITQNLPITFIPDPGAAEKTAVKSAIDSLASDGLTAMFDAAAAALNPLVSYRAPGGGEPNRIVFLLSDGLDNSSTRATEASVISSYQAADTPLVTFGYGFFAPTGVLRRLADGTGGRFYSSPTTLVEILGTFLDAITEFSPTLGIAAGEDEAPALAAGAILHSFLVDPTLRSLVVLATFPGSSSDLGVALQAPDGSLGPAFSCTTIPGTTASPTTTTCVATVDLGALGTPARLGTWRLMSTSHAFIGIPVTLSVLANPGDERPYDLTLDLLGGSTVHYPEPIVATATVSRERPIQGLGITATLKPPSDALRSVPMNDEGREGDGVAGDGVYSAILGYEEDGLYSLQVAVNNDAGTGRFTYAGLQPSPDLNGKEPEIPDFPPLGENFQRVANLQFSVEGLTASGGDDHPDQPPGTPVAADNTDVAGRIDRLGDVDYFQIHGIRTDTPLIMRVANLAQGMKPLLTLFRADGSTRIAQGDLTDASSARGYLFLTVPPADLDPSGVLVARVTAADGAIGGTYEISAGSGIASDQPAGGTCVSSSFNLCLKQDRFAIEVDWQDFSGQQGHGVAMPLTSDTGSFWFFGPDNVELVIKVLDGRAINGHFWVFYASLSSVKFTVRVTDTATGNTATYINPSGRLASVGDAWALPAGLAASPSHLLRIEPGKGSETPASSSQSEQPAGQLCTATATSLCLNGGRFQVEVAWTDFQSRQGSGQAVSLTDRSGYFWFFDAANVELVLKVLDGRPLNGRWWVFFGALTNVEYTIQVTDTITGRVVTYFNPAGRQVSVADIGAFAD